ncbi:ubiquitin recognition factor in ER-associated degradation protein 1 isoform X1 [Dermacentor albipictus]|uniref:ubiquitin recognition factor in ER-associated degradation protein 1 isoform X1 n=2 Tax=Dermacentor albipictus TaxID=60249 RepID=UPI0031FD9A9E
MFPFNMFHDHLARPFNTQYRSYSVSMLPGNERQDVERGGKIIMPPSALDHLTRLNIVYPMLFKLTNKKSNRETHCGVLEFVADEGKVYLPYWMQRNLLLDEGDLVQVESATLPVATFSKFQPLSVDFLDITNPKAVLENALRNFACLSTGDIIAIEYNNKTYELCVLETKPGKAVSIIECDMNVEFAPPVGYKEPEPRNAPKKQEKEAEMDYAAFETEPAGFVAFSGTGNRLDGKVRSQEGAANSTVKSIPKRGIPDYDYTIGTLRFIRTARPTVEDTEGKTKDEFSAFSGKAHSLRQQKTVK